MTYLKDVSIRDGHLQTFSCQTDLYLVLNAGPGIRVEWTNACKPTVSEEQL